MRPMSVSRGMQGRDSKERPVVAWTHVPEPGCLFQAGYSRQYRQ
jgi:hypothetical protein